MHQWRTIFETSSPRSSEIDLHLSRSATMSPLAVLTGIVDGVENGVQEWF
jgi:hypothetical protein